MKLHELGARRPQEQVAKVFESHLGDRVSFANIGADKAQRMLGKIRKLVKEHRASPSFHYSERNPDYLRLIMIEQALKAHLNEITSSIGAVVADPKAKPVMDKARRGQALTPDEQDTMNKIALSTVGQPAGSPATSTSPIKEKYMGFKKTAQAIKKGGSARDPEAVAAAIGRKKYGKAKFQKAAATGKKLGESLKRLSESEIQQAQVVMAAQDMVDQIQKMLEQVSAMQFKDLPALTDAIKNDVGVDQASQFQASSATALTNLLQALQQGKTELESAQGVLTGQAPQVPGMAPAAAAPTEPGAEVDADLSLDANLPPAEPDDEEEISSAGLGRERR